MLVWAQENGLICGGRMDVHIDPLMPSPRLFIIGAGHVGHQLARMAGEVGFRIHVVDDREKFANAERFPGADVVVEPIPEWLHRADLPASSYVVVVTRGHQHDLDAMRALAARDFMLQFKPLWQRAAVAAAGPLANFVVAIALFTGLLLSSGQVTLPPECLQRVHAPIGLDIGAVTPAEIAVSILAELIAISRGVDTSSMSMKGVRIKAE